VSLLAVKGLKAQFDSVELALEDKSSTFEVANGKKGSGDEVVRACERCLRRGGHAGGFGSIAPSLITFHPPTYSLTGAAGGQDLLPVRARDGAHDAAGHQAEAGRDGGGHGVAAARQGRDDRGRESAALADHSDQRSLTTHPHRHPTPSSSGSRSRPPTGRAARASCASARSGSPRST